jgi:hypothetical protein
MKMDKRNATQTGSPVDRIAVGCEAISIPASRLELARDEVDRVFGNGHAAAHPELVVAIVHAASSDWAARVICAALEDIAGALVEGGVQLPGNAGLVAARSIVRP